MMTMRKQITDVLTVAVVAMGVAGMTPGTAQAGTVALTSVDQLDFDNVVKAYDFTFTSKEGEFDIGGVTFTRHNWGAENPHTYDGLTMTDQLAIDNQGSGAPNITEGGTAMDRANLNDLLDCWNIGGGGDVDFSIALPNGTYKVQYIVGVGQSNRDNELFNITPGEPGVSLGAWSGSGNWLITDTVDVTGGTLDLRAKEGLVAGGDNRRVFSGLMINSTEAPQPVGGSVAVKRIELEVVDFVGLKQWQASATGASDSFTNLTDAITSTLDVTELYQDTPWFRVKVTSGSHDPVYSDTMKVVENPVGDPTVIFIQ